MKRSVLRLFAGMGLGMLGNLIGFVIYGLLFSWMNEVSFGFFYENVFKATPLFRSQILTGALLVNILLFYVLQRRQEDQLNKGVLVTILLTVIGIVYYYA